MLGLAPLSLLGMKPKGELIERSIAFHDWGHDYTNNVRGLNLFVEWHMNNNLLARIGEFIEFNDDHLINCDINNIENAVCNTKFNKLYNNIGTQLYIKNIHISMHTIERIVNSQPTVEQYETALKECVLQIYTKSPSKFSVNKLETLHIQKDFI